jgi:acyl carrier protein
MSGTTARTDRVVSGGHVQVLITEFEKQRGMLLKLFESQNALLASVLGGAPVEVAPEAVEHRPAPVLVTEPPPQPFIHQREHAPTVSAAVESAPIPQAPPPIAPAVAVTKPAPAPAPAPAQPPAGAANLFEYVRSLMAKAVQMQESDIDPDQNFMELGADSMTAMTMVKEMEQRYNIELPATLLFEYTTLNELVDYLKTEIGDNSGGAQRA